MHPILYLPAEGALTILIIGFTAPSSPLRPAGLVLIAYWLYKCVPLCMPALVRTPWAALVGGYAATWAYHYLDVALLNKWSFEKRGPTGGHLRLSNKKEVANDFTKAKGTLAIDRLKFGFNVFASPRFIGTPYQAANTPEPVAVEREHFLLRELGIIIVSYVVLDAIQSQNDTEISAEFLTVGKVPIFSRLSEVTAKEVAIRSCTVLAAAIAMNCVQGGVYHIFALLAVSCKVSEPRDWPPLFGSYREAYTLRRFWNICWHQTTARKLSSTANFTVHHVLRLRRGTKTARFARVIVAFFASGLLHIGLDLSAGIRPRDSGAVHTFVAQAGGMIIEDGIQQSYSTLPPQWRLPTWLERPIGYLWTAVFLIWSVPAYMYPIMWRSNLGLKDGTVPFSFFEPLERSKATGCLVVAGLVAVTGILLG